VIAMIATRGGAAPSTQPVADATPATTQPTSAVKGVVRAEGDVPLAEMVVFLESPEKSRAMSKPDAAVRVSQKGAQFDPRLVVVTVGQSIDFLNDEKRLIEHNVFSNSPAKRFDLGLYGPGISKQVVFDKPGAVFLYCSIHRYMDGVIFVAPTPYFSRVNPKGEYSIEGVPPGKWTLKTWQRRRRFPEKTIPVVVAADGTPNVDIELKKRK
jgi:plastocyanin